MQPINPYQQWEIQGQFTKSYTTPAIITLILYIFLWIPGLIANILYLIEANKTKTITGRTPDGYGCLWLLLIVVCFVPAVSTLSFLGLLAIGLIGR